MALAGGEQRHGRRLVVALLLLAKPLTAGVLLAHQPPYTPCLLPAINTGLAPPMPCVQSNLLSPNSSRRLNAFQLINAGLDISAMFEQREDVVARYTRFTTRAPPKVLADALEDAAVAVGGRVERRAEDRWAPGSSGVCAIPTRGSASMSCKVRLPLLPLTCVPACLQAAAGGAQPQGHAADHVRDVRGV